ncbi:hypothetical protein K435DRAFT_812866 [Dendrothele bispora CBS 962.96]|uniref:Uncharacterized protein n=1 Tax=Dendrothele bispora (strain CBS 962.96) TaxID=1314807 RepID=A0A4S8KMY1_DENBC|nr:hypothetical protein K435DRAFT_812866 [Dendrothele bispora CBS 962.96]
MNNPKWDRLLFPTVQKMPKKARAAAARASNLTKARTKLPQVSSEDVPKDENSPPIPNSDNSPNLVDESEDSGTDNDSQFPEIHETTALEHFNTVLQNDHDLAQKQAQERDANRKRPKQYRGNSKRKKQHDLKKGRDLMKKGFPSVKNWLIKTDTHSETEMEASSSTVPVDTSSVSYDTDISESSDTPQDSFSINEPGFPAVSPSHTCASPLLVGEERQRFIEGDMEKEEAEGTRRKRVVQEMLDNRRVDWK